ncbi:heavy metal translocating P-type ATPase [Desulfobulbus sp. TB]|nr:heavy metal translocating P-type ATPase [Desulfobulbus sp. TB]
MILLGLETLATVYIVTRVIEKKRAETNEPIKDVNKNGLLNPDGVEVNEKEKQVHHYLKVNTVAIATTLMGYVYYPARLISLGLISYSTVPILKEAEKSLLVEKRIKNDLLNSIVSVVCIGTGQYFTAALVAGFFHLGDKMVIKTKDRSKAMINDAFQQQPNKVWLLTDDGIEVETAIETIQVNDIIVVNTGNIVPVDGTVVEGAAMIDQHALTGESLLSEKTVGDYVLATTLVISGKVLVRIELAGIDTTAAKIGEILKHTASYKTSIQSRSEQWADKAAVPLIGAAGILLPIIGILPATTILYSSPGNAIKTFASLQTFNYLIFLSKQGILVKDGRALEELRKVDTVIFDKTGTLTIEQPAVGKVITCDDLSETQILSYAAAAEHKLTHPIARAILQHANDNELPIIPIENAHYQMGYGITVHKDNTIIQVGSLRFMVMEGISVPSIIKKAQTDCHKQGHSVVAVAVNKQIKGVIEIKPQLKPEIKTMLKNLRQHKVKHISIVSGDHKQPTQKLAKELEMDSYFYDVLPQEKATIIEKLQKQGKTICFVGDGINDSLAIKQANVSISFSDASAITADLAQIILMDGNVSHLPVLFEVAEKLSTDTKGILAMLGCIATLSNVGAVFFRMHVIGAIGFQVAENIMGLSYTMRPPLTNQRQIKGSS